MRSLSLVAPVLALAAVPLVVSLASARAEAASPDEDAARAVALQYFKAHATGSPDEMRKVFHPEGRLQFVRDGKLTTISAEEFCSRQPGKAPEDEAQRKRRVVSVDVTGDAAVVKVELDYPKVFFTDYLSMLKVDGRWGVVEKTFVRRDK